MKVKVHKMTNSDKEVNKIIKQFQKDGKLNILTLPDDAINNVTVDNWEEYFDQYLVVEIPGDRLDTEPKIYEYVWKPEVMKEFIRKLI